MESNKENVRHHIKTDKNYTPYESIKSYQKYYRATYGVFPKRRRLVAIPKCAAFGLNDLPILVRLAAVGMLCGLVGKYSKIMKMFAYSKIMKMMISITLPITHKIVNFNYLNVAFISYKLTMWDLMLFSGCHTRGQHLRKKDSSC